MLMVEQLPVHPMLNQLIPESAKYRVVGRFLRNAETDKTSKRQTIIEDFLECIIGQVVPGLQEKAFEQKKYGVTGSSIWRRIDAIQSLLKRLPLDESVYFVEVLIEFLVVP